jgi:hypothetical protein
MVCDVTAKQAVDTGERGWYRLASRHSHRGRFLGLKTQLTRVRLSGEGLDKGNQPKVGQRARDGTYVLPWLVVAT